MATERYKLKPDAYLTMNRKIIIGYSVVVPGLFIGFFLFQLFPNARFDKDLAQQIGYTALIAVGFMVYSLIKRLRSYKERYSTFEITIDETSLKYSQAKTPSLDLGLLEITKIFKDSAGNFIVYSGPDKPSIIIPSSIENASQLEARLNKICPIVISPPPKLTARIIGYLPMVGVVAMVIFINFNQNKVVAGITGPIASATFIRVFFLLHKNKHLTARVNLLKWILLIPAIGLLVKTFSVLSGINVY